MRIVIVGGGGAGLVLAWLLSSVADVTLLEAGDRLGGHMRTIEVPTPRGPVYAEMGFKFFFKSTYPIFCAIHKTLGLQTTESKATISVTAAPGKTVVAPPSSLRHFLQWVDRPSLAFGLWEYYRLLFHSPEVVAKAGGPSVQQAAEDWGMNPKRIQAFFLPLIAANWGSPLADIADNPWWEIREVMLGAKEPVIHLPQGLGGYVAELRRSMPTVKVECNNAVRSIDRDGVEWRVVTERGPIPADHVIIATEAPTAADLVGSMPDKTAVAKALSEIHTYHTTIAVHRDPSWMPMSRRDWSAINVFFHHTHPWQTEWSGRELNVEVFRSWVIPGRQLPKIVVATHQFRHVIFRSELLSIQSTIRETNGQGNLWIAGMCTTGADLHESAVRSAIAVVQRLAPHSPQLSVLRQAVPEGRWPKL